VDLLGNQQVAVNRLSEQELVQQLPIHWEIHE